MDSEQFTPWQTWLTSVGLSANAQASGRHRDCHSADTLSPSLLIHLLNAEGIHGVFDRMGIKGFALSNVMRCIFNKLNGGRSRMRVSLVGVSVGIHRARQ